MNKDFEMYCGRVCRLMTHKPFEVNPSSKKGTRKIKNFTPLRFHQIHGDNVKLQQNGSVAYRSDGFCMGLAFSDRPVAVGEPVFIKFLEINENWSGALRIGFTMNDPVTMKSNLPRYVCPDMTSDPGNWAKPVSERMVKENSILHYYVDKNGDIRYGIDSEEHGVFLCGVNISTKLWAVIDIYGNTVSIEFVCPNSVNQEYLNDVLPVSTIEEIPNSVAPTNEMMYSPSFFHYYHGKNITLKSRQTVAARKSGSRDFAYVFVGHSLKVDKNLIFEVLQTKTSSNNSTLIYGVTSCDPSNLKTTELPLQEHDLMDRPEYWIVESDVNVYNLGDFIIFNLNKEGALSVLKNGDNKQNELYVDCTQPLWLFFNMVGAVSEVQLVGSSSSDILPEILALISHYSKSKIASESETRDEILRLVESASVSTSVNDCVICHEVPVNCALYRCGHMCLCYRCAEKMWTSQSTVKCPICRDVAQDFIKIYQ